MVVYYGLTKAESKGQYLIYNSNQLYDKNGINLTLKGLKNFIRDNDMTNIIQYYTKIPLNNFKKIKDILKDEEYDMITVELPFKFKIEKVYKINWR